MKKDKGIQTDTGTDKHVCIFYVLINLCKNTEKVWVRKAPGSERSWVGKGLGPNRLFLFGPKGLGSETSDIH